jgi:hypothetical protein
VFAELKEPVHAKLVRYDLIGILDPSHFFPTIESAIEAYSAEPGASVGVRPSQSEVRTPL